MPSFPVTIPLGPGPHSLALGLQVFFPGPDVPCRNGGRLMLLCGMDGHLSSWAGIQQVTDANRVIYSAAAQEKQYVWVTLGQ